MSSFSTHKNNLACGCFRLDKKLKKRSTQHGQQFLAEPDHNWLLGMHFDGGFGDRRPTVLGNHFAIGQVGRCQIAQCNHTLSGHRRHLHVGTQGREKWWDALCGPDSMVVLLI
jgi:hypothetical protein